MHFLYGVATGLIVGFAAATFVVVRYGRKIVASVTALHDKIDYIRYPPS